MKRSRQAAFLAAALRVCVRPALRWTTHVQRARRGLDKAARWTARLPADVAREQIALERDGRVFPAVRLTPNNHRNGLVVHFHGGGYIAGSPETHLILAANIARQSGCQVLLPELPLAPEHPFPAAFETAYSFWHALLDTDIDTNRIAFGGDSAGGGLALALSAHLSQRKPAALYAMSPWCDLTFSGASMVENRRLDPMFPACRAPFLAGLVLQGHPADDPRISSVFAEPRDPPPLWLSVSQTELIRDDARRMAEKWAKAGAKVDMVERYGLVHAWPYFHFLPEARQDIMALGRFLTQAFSQETRLFKTATKAKAVST